MNTIFRPNYGWTIVSAKSVPWILWQLQPPRMQRRAHEAVALARRLRACSTVLPPGGPDVPIDAVELRTRYGSFWFDSTDQKLTPWIRRQATWEADVLRLLRRSVRAGMTAVDVGANIGFHTIRLSRLVGSHGAVHAFEPLPVTVDILRANVWRHSCTNTVVHPVAVSDHAGPVAIELDVDGRSGARLALGGDTPIEAVTLDQALAGRRVDVLKVDVEGAEPLVLRGAVEVLKASPSLLAVVEFRAEPHLNGSGPEHVLREYERIGFRLERLRPDGRTVPASPDELITSAAAAGTLNVVLRRSP